MDMAPRTKGISPIITTILLIVISLILVGILLSWGETFIQKSTSDADNAIDRKCIGADIDFSFCEYNNTSKKLSLIIVNSGKVNFKEDTNLSLILIDSENNLFNGATNILDGEAFPVGASEQLDIDVSDADPALIAPIDVEIRSSQCANFFKRAICR